MLTKVFFFSSLVYVDHFSAFQGVSCFFRHFYNYFWLKGNVVFRVRFLRGQIWRTITAEKVLQTNEQTAKSRNEYKLWGYFCPACELWRTKRVVRKRASKGLCNGPFHTRVSLACRLLVTFHVIPNWRACCQASLIWKTVHVSYATTQIRWHFPNMAWHCRSFFSALIIIFNQR